MPRTPPRARSSSDEIRRWIGRMHHDRMRQTVGWVSGEKPRNPPHRSVGFAFAQPTLQAERKDEKRKQNAGRRRLPTSATAVAALPPGGRSTPSGVPLRLSPRRLSSPRLSVRPCFLGRGRSVRSSTAAQPGAEILRSSTGVTRAGKTTPCPSPAKHLARRS